ncbi:GNAT family N-acetyltransferase [candidate division KSB1 bacterium]|nr:GNAT family N-acetyltransferase [candidate division KSB1 bacterium]
MFHTHRFIRAIEDARVENSRFWYLLFYQREALVGAAALSAFVVSLDLFVAGILQKLAGSIRRFFPGFLKIKVLFCGLPISIGKHCLAISDLSRSKEIFDLLVREMLEIGRAENLRFMCVKEFLEGELPMVERLAEYKFFRAWSIPYVSMKIRWPDFQSYLAAMRHSYRRQICRSLKKLGQSEPIIHTGTSSGTNGEKPVLILASPKLCTPKQFSGLYLEVMSRAKTKLERLNEAFFENFYKNMSNDFELLAMMKGREILNVALLTVQDKTMTFLLTGIDYSKRDEHNTYCNLLYGIIVRAMQRGCERLDLGQTSYWLKQRLGGECIPQFFYLRAESRLIHFFLKALRPVIFPGMKTPTPRVFR